MQTPLETRNTKSEILLSLVPPLPPFPEFPTLHWTYEGGLYSIGEEDVDKLLDYGENKIPLYKDEIERYKRKMELILKALESE